MLKLTSHVGEKPISKAITENHSSITLPFNARLIFSRFLWLFYDQFKNIFRSSTFTIIFFCCCFYFILLLAHVFFFIHFELLAALATSIMVYAFIFVAFKRESEILAIATKILALMRSNETFGMHVKEVVNEILRLNNSKKPQNLVSARINYRASFLLYPFLFFFSVFLSLSLSLSKSSLRVFRVFRVFRLFRVCVCVQNSNVALKNTSIFIHLCLKRLINTIWGFLSRLGRLLLPCFK